MADKSKYIKYTIIEEVAVSDFLSSKDSVIGDLTKESFLRYQDDNDKSNADIIYSKYTKKEKTESRAKYSKFDLDIIKANTTINIPLSEYQEQLFVIGGENLFLDQTQKLPAYFVEKQKELQSDPTYVKADQIAKTGSGIDLQQIEENVQVWIYIKSIDKLIDVSPFINSISISKSDIGSFSINLNPIEVKIDRESDTITAVFVSSTNGKEYLNQYPIKRLDGTVNTSFFEKYCQQNDAVFIRFEKLEIEENNTNVKFGSHNIEASKQNLPNQVFDMIGLVDSVNSSINTEVTDYSVNIAGRDLMKMLVEDGAYLMDITYARGAENMFYFLGEETDKYFKRNFVSEGAFEYLFREYFNPLDTYMGFIINQLSNVGWTGDNDLFNYYLSSADTLGDSDKRISAAYKIGVTNEQRYLENIEVNGAWKICKLKIDPNLSTRRVIDNSFIDQDGTLYEQFKKVCQEPFVEFWGDTYGSQFNFIARQQPFDRKGMKEILSTEGYVIDIEAKDTYQINLGWETEFYSWFQFFPTNQAFGDDRSFLSANFPIIYLDKYVENFGNHKKVIEDNYVFGRAVDTKKGKKNKESIAKGLYNDLKYVIESLSILPFTRTGNVVINGDRRIKKGSFIRLKATGEICYIDSVVNSATFNKAGVNRTTTLSLKRCMYERYLDGGVTSNVNVTADDTNLNDDEIRLVSQLKTEGRVFLQTPKVTPKKISYYDIVKSDIIIEELLRRYENNQETSNKVTASNQQIKTDFGVNEEVFDFFLQRRQMDKI